MAEKFVVYHGNPSKDNMKAIRAKSPSRIDNRAEFTAGTEQSSMTLNMSLDERYMLDNGAYAVYIRDNDKWMPSKFVKSLDKAKGDMMYSPDFVVLPDVVGDAIATKQRIDGWIGLIRDYEFSYYYPLQPSEKISIMEQFRFADMYNSDGVFVGGNATFKRDVLSMLDGALDKLDQDLAVHVGRVGDLTDGRNLAKAILIAENQGVDSIDTTSVVQNQSYDVLERLKTQRLYGGDE